jgi:hypothetical protein
MHLAQIDPRREPRVFVFVQTGSQNANNVVILRDA